MYTDIWIPVDSWCFPSIDMKPGLPFCRRHFLLCRHGEGGHGMAGAGWTGVDAASTGLMNTVNIQN